MKADKRPSIPDGPLEKLVGFALNKRLFSLFVSIALLLAGLWAFFSIAIDAVPDISNIQVTVTTTARGLAPGEVEQYITYPVELALQSMPKLHLQRSISKYALSQVTAVFEDGTDIYWARQQVSERLKSAQGQMPPNNDVSINLGPIATGLGEIYQFELRGPGYSLMQLREILDWQVIPALKTVPGIDEVQSMGGEAKEYQIWLKPERLHGYEVTPSEVCTALRNSNANTGGGYVVEQSDQILLRAQGLLASTKDIENVLIKRSQNGAVRIKDLAEVKIGKMLPQSIVTAGGKGETVIGIVIMRKGENSRELVGRIKKEIELLKPTLPENIQIVPFYDRGDLVDHTIETVKDNLMHGALLVLVVLFLLLGNWRGGLVAATAIPLSLAGSLLFLNLSGVSANLLSLGAVDFGILIDGSVVMVENILRRLHAAKQNADGAEETLNTQNRLGTIAAAAKEVATPVFAAVTIITVVYLPILGLPGVASKTFQPMALTVVFGLITALFVALFVTPSLSYFLLEKQVQEKEAFLMRLMNRPYRKLLLAAVKRPSATALTALALFAGSLLCLPHLGSEFIPVLREGSLVLGLTRPVSGSLATAAAQTTMIEKAILENKYVETVVSRTGRSEIAFDPMGPDESDVFVIFKPKWQWPPNHTQQDLETAINKKLNESIPGLIYSMSQPIEQRMNELVAGARSDVAVRVFGSDLDKLKEIGNEIGARIAKIDGCADLKLEQTSGLPVVSAKLNQTALAAYGVFASDALNTVAAAVDGLVVGTIYEGKPRFPLTVRFEPDCLKTADDIAELPVAARDGTLVPLRQIAKVERDLTSAQIAHHQGNRTYMVQFNVRGRDLGSFVAEAQKDIAANIKLPSGYHIEWGGQFENMRIAQERLFILVPVSLLLIFALLFMLYNDLKPGLLIFTNIPLAFSGGIVALYLRQMPLSVTAGVGFIALFGVAVLNGVVLVSTIRQFEAAGMQPRQAAVAAARQRLRPVLMTALVASLGFIPMAIATSVGAEVQRPLATVVIAGLITSTALTLLVLPALYPKVCRKRKEPS